VENSELILIIGCVASQTRSLVETGAFLDLYDRVRPAVFTYCFSFKQYLNYGDSYNESYRVVHLDGKWRSVSRSSEDMLKSLQFVRSEKRQRPRPVIEYEILLSSKLSVPYTCDGHGMLD
jgi:hypothetical protein